MSVSSASDSNRASSTRSSQTRDTAESQRSDAKRDTTSPSATPSTSTDTRTKTADTAAQLADDTKALEAQRVRDDLQADRVEKAVAPEQRVPTDVAQNLATRAQESFQAPPDTLSYNPATRSLISRESAPAATPAAGPAADAGPAPAAPTPEAPAAAAPAAAAPAAAAPDVAPQSLDPAAAPAAPAAPTPAELAADINTLAATDPTAAAEKLRDAITGNTDAEFRSSLIDGSRTGLETIGSALVTDGTDPTKMTDALGTISETLHRDGQADTAAKLAGSVAEGLDAKDRANANVDPNRPFDAARDRALFANAIEQGVVEGRTADFAADLTIALDEKARCSVKEPFMGPVDRASSLALSVNNALTEGVHTATQNFERAHKDLIETQGHVQEAARRFGDTTTPEAAAAATDAVLAPKLEAADRAAGPLVEATNAAARVVDAVPETSRALRAEAESAVERAVTALPDAADTITGRTALADVFSRSMKGEPTFLETVAKNPNFSQETRAAAFTAGTKGAQLTASVRAGLGEDVGPVLDHLDKQSGALLPAADATAVQNATAALRANPEELKGLTGALDALDRADLSESAKATIAAFGLVKSATGATGALKNIINGVDRTTLERYPGLGKVFAGASLVGKLSSAVTNLADGKLTAGDVLSSASFANEAAVMLGGKSPLTTALGKTLGALGAGYGLYNAFDKGDGLGVLSSSLALGGLVSGNPWVAAAGGLIDVGRLGYEVHRDARLQGEANRQFLEGAGFDPAQARTLADYGGFSRQALDFAAEAIQAREPGLTRQEAIKRFLETDGDISRVQYLIEARRPYDGGRSGW